MESNAQSLEDNVFRMDLGSVRTLFSYATTCTLVVHPLQKVLLDEAEQAV